MKYLSIPTHSFESFKSFVNAIPLLNREDELTLFEKAQAGCSDSRNKIIYHNIKSVFYVVSDFAWNKVPTEDLVQEGCIGLLEAISRFDVKAGVRFFTYSYFYIKNKVMLFIKNNLGVVRLTDGKKNRTIFNNFKSLINDSDINSIKHSHIKKIADTLSVNELDVIETINYIYGNNSILVSNEDGEEDYIDSEYLITKFDDPFVNEDYETVINALEILSEDHRYIIQKYFLDENPLTLQEIAAIMNKSFQAVQQQMKTAIKRLKKELNDEL